jgi:hypothetical protein
MDGRGHPGTLSPLSGRWATGDLGDGASTAGSDDLAAGVWKQWRAKEALEALDGESPISFAV